MKTEEWVWKEISIAAHLLESPKITFLLQKKSYAYNFPITSKFTIFPRVIKYPSLRIKHLFQVTKLNQNLPYFWYQEWMKTSDIKQAHLYRYK
jgi:hypothetical protein